MSPRLVILLILPALGVLTLGAWGDRAVREQARTARERAQADAARAAELRAQAVLATLARVERDVAAGTAVPGATAWRVTIPPRRSPPRGTSPAHGALSRAQLAPLLDATGSTDSGLPVAVVAALALGDADVTSRVAEKLLDGGLPVHPDDVAFLARELGRPDDPRLATLRARLEAAMARDPPNLPAFRLTLDRDDLVHGWSRDRTTVLHFAVAPGLLGAAAGPTGPAYREVPGVAGLVVAVDAAATPVRLAALRVGLWVAVTVCLLGLVTLVRSVAREAATAAQERRFLASVTHELRTPLASLRLLGETLASGRGAPQEYGTLIARESERLSALVDNVLAATRGGEAPSFTPCDPAEIARSVADLARPRAERRGITLGLEVAAADARPSWDVEAVRRALLNLVDNAILHGPAEAPVTIATSRATDGTWRLAVTDRGVGPRRRERQRIFGRFQRGTTDAPGTGLGLHLAEQVARCHGGRVDLVADEGTGCAFALVLPERPPARGGAPA
jgi:signal transduction histidine kinase